MPKIYLRRPDGAIVAIDEQYAQQAANSGYTTVDQESLTQARSAQAGALPKGEAVSRGLLQAAPSEGVNLETGLSQESSAFANSVLSGATFGQAPGLDTPENRAIGLKFRQEHPGQEMFAQVLGQAPLALAGGVAGGAIRAGAAGAGLATRAGALAADVGLNAAIGGAQIEGEESRLAGEEFSFTDAAIAGVAVETLGRGAAWTVSKTVGGARNLIARAARDAVAADAERSLTKGGWVGDYRTAEHAEKYRDELADLGARDLDTLETAHAEVSRQDRKRARIMRAVVEHPAAQHEINVQAIENMQRLRAALADELADAGGPAKRLAKQLDDRVAALEEAPKGRKLWKLLDENRQALQEYRQDLYQAYDSNPGSAWLSREGLAAIDAAEESTRMALLREDAWGEAAARMQREYNVPFHEKWFPARQTILKDLYFATGKDAQGFTLFRGEPAKMRKFLTGLGGTSPDAHRAREFFTQYLDGAEAIARAGELDSPAAARDALEAVRRLRKNLANATFINAAAERTAGRAAVAGAVGDLAAGTVGLALGGPGGAAGGVVASRFVRSAKVGEWFGNVAKHLGLFKGDALSMAEILGKDALPAARDAAEDLTERLAGDILDAPFPKATSARPPGPGGPVAPRPTRGVGVDLPRPPSTHPGVGQARRAAADYPAGMEAIKPGPRPIDVGATPPKRPGGGFTPLERPESLRAGETIPGVSDAPSIREGAEVPLPEQAFAETFPAPVRTAAAAAAERELAPGAAARAAEARRMQALTEGEFAHVVDGLNATGAKASDGTPLGNFLARHSDDLKTAGLIVAGGGASALAAQYEGGEGVAAAGAGGLVLLAAGRRGRRLPGDWFAAAKPATQQALGALEKLGFETSQPVANMFTKTFGDRMPTPEQLEKLIPLRALEQLGGGAPAAEQRIVKLGDAVHWYAESVETAMPPHNARMLDGTFEHDPGGYPAPVWKIARTFTKEPNGDLVVHHDYFYLRQDVQGSGAGAQVLKDQMEVYRQLGVKTVEVSCDDVGRYFWPSIGFDHADRKVIDKAVRAYQNFVVQNKLTTPDAVMAEAKTIRSLPRLANAEFGKEFLLSTRGDWNLHLELHLDDADPRFHLMRHRLGVSGETARQGAAAAPALAMAAPPDLVGQIEGEADTGRKDRGVSAAGPAAGFVGAVALFKQARARLVSDVARRLFSPTVGRHVARVVAKATYTRAEMAKRRAEFQAWQENPQELVDRVAEGFRDVPPDQQPATYAGIFKAAAFLKERLPTSTKANAISMREVPVSTEQLTKFARYEEAALRPREAWSNAAARGYIGEELLETTGELHPDLLAELRVGAYLQVREEGAPVTVQARLQYARLFDGRGEFADPSMAPEVAAMSALAYEAAVPPKPGGGPAGTSGGVSHTAAAVSRPAGLARVG